MEKGKLLAEGRTAEVFQLGERKILKLFKSFMPKESAETEYNISLNLMNQLTIVPKVYDFVMIENRYGIIYEKISGEPMMVKISKKPWTVKKEAKRLAKLHTLIHKETNLELPSNITTLKNQISYTDLLQEDVKIKLSNYIDTLEVKDKLCHGDLHPDNVLITEEESLIIDWMTATKGNPLADVARTSIMFKFAVIPEKSFLEKMIITLIRNKFLHNYITNYIKLSGVSLGEIEKWELPVAAARLIEGIPKEEKAKLVNYINTKAKELP